MNSNSAAGAERGGWTLPGLRRFSMPAWVASLVLHIVLIIVLGLTLQLTPKGVPAEKEQLMAGEVVLKHHTDEGDYYETQQDAQSDSRQTASNPTEKVLSDVTDPGVGADLPHADVGPIRGADPGGGLSGGLTGNPRQPKSGAGGKARTSVFNIASEGHSFVYVFDRSASMSSPNNLPLNAAKGAMKGSLATLQSTHTFHVIFYNERPLDFTLPGGKRRLLFATDQNKTLANRFIDGVVADGSTKHYEALLMAVRLGPDVIYMLTDADRKDNLTPGETSEILKRNRAGAVINTIQFGFHDYVPEETFLVRLARETGGQYKYINVRDLARNLQP